MRLIRGSIQLASAFALLLTALPAQSASEPPGLYTLHAFIQGKSVGSENSPTVEVPLHVGMRAESVLDVRTVKDLKVKRVEGVLNSSLGLAYLAADGHLYTKGKYQHFSKTLNPFGGEVVEGYFRIGSYRATVLPLKAGDPLEFEWASNAQLEIPGIRIFMDPLFLKFNEAPEPVRYTPELLYETR